MGGKEAGRKRTVGKEGLREWEKEEVRREEVERGRWRERGAEMVREGVFGAMMQVALVNDGPVTVEVVVEAPAGVEKGEKKGGKGEKKEGSKEGKKGKKEKARRWREENMKSGEKASDTNGEEEVREVLSGEEEEAENPIRIGLAGGRE